MADIDRHYFESWFIGNINLFMVRDLIYT